MQPQRLAIHGCFSFRPVIHADERGSFLEWYRHDALELATGRTLHLRQSNISVSHRGVARGVHFAVGRPGQAKYVTVVRGRGLDILVDLRVGSPTFGAVESVVLDDRDRVGVWIPEGVGHSFIAQEDATTLCYLTTDVFRPEREHAVNLLDPELELPVPLPAEDLIISARDRQAPSLAEARLAGLLPRWSDYQSATEVPS